jgi:hypothetical protein
MVSIVRIAGLAALMTVLAACGGGGGSGGTTQAQPPPVANRAPVISGTPATSVTRDDRYFFAPAASDPDGDMLTFSIDNQPAWAAFDNSTGTLTGTPAAPTPVRW